MKIVLLLATIFAISRTHEFVPGCLQYDTENDVCKFCDQQQGYIIQNGSCRLRKQPNCSLQDFEGNCLICQTKYYLEQYTQECLEVPEFGLVNKCNVYRGPNVCEVCESGTYLNRENQCIQFASPIANCHIYLSGTLCYKCQSGNVLSADSTSCISPTPKSNCESYSQFVCDSCKDGYKVNPNNYIYDLLSFSSKRNIRLLERQLMSEITKDLPNTYETCQKLDLPNCLTYAEFNKCAVCENNFYKMNDYCYPYPIDEIENCVNYSNSTTCIECQSGFLLVPDLDNNANSYKCMEIDNSQLSNKNCRIFDGKSDRVICKVCDDSYYLNIDNCQLRNQQNIQNCESYSKTEDNCQECLDKFSLTSDNLSCLPEVEFCQAYELSFSSSNKLICNKCMERYSLDTETNTCSLGNVRKCLEYSIEQKDCVQCENRYYVSNGICKNHEDLIYCDEYDQKEQNSCKNCSDKSMLFKVSNTCLPVQQIPFCDVYLTQEECQKCKDGYTLDSNQCKLIPGTEFCLQKVDGQCIKCLENYILQDGTCNFPLHHLVRNCENNSVDGLTGFANFKCEYCKQFSIPINYKNSFLCFEENFLVTQKNLIMVDDCLQYKSEQGNIVCSKCDNEKVLNDGVCVDECPADKTWLTHQLMLDDQSGNSNKDSFVIDRIDVCGVKVKNCNLASPDLDQDLTDIRYSCVECSENSISLVDFSSKKLLIKKNTLLLSPISFSPSKVCKNPLDEKILGNIEDDVVKDCDLYYSLTDYGLGCLKCEHGKTGEVVDLVYQCQVYSSLISCSKCKQGYYLEFPYRCKRVNTIDFCELYDQQELGTCTQCMDEYFFDNQNCQKRTNMVENCDTYQKLDDECEICEDGFHLFDGDCYRNLSNCSQYNLDQDECISCNNSYYLLNNKCFLGSVNNCEIYSQNGFQSTINKCTKCDNTFYLNEEENLCTIQPPINNCSVYKQELGLCQECELNHLMFFKEKKCLPTVVIENCKEYFSVHNCKTCVEGFMPTNYGQRCLALPDDYHCLQWGSLSVMNGHPVQEDVNNCLKCQPESLLINGQCRKWFRSYLLMCDKTKINDVNNVNQGIFTDFECEFCSDFTEPMDLETYGHCLEDTFLETITGNHATIPNCMSYNELDNVTKQSGCIECAANYYVFVDPDTSVTSCISKDGCISKTDHHVVLQPLQDSQTEILMTKGSSCLYLPSNDTRLLVDGTFDDQVNCYLSPVVNNSTKQDGVNAFEYACVRCFEGYIQVVPNTNQNSHLNLASYQFEQDPQFMVFHPTFYCSDPLKHFIYGEVLPNNTVKNCDYYYEIDTQNNLGCLSCKNTFTGPVINITEDFTFNILGYINSCSTTVIDCNNSTIDNKIMSTFAQEDNYLSGSFNLQMIFNSCSQCNTDNFVPVAVLNYDNVIFAGIQGLNSFNPAGMGVDPVLLEQTGYSMYCLDITDAGQIFDLTAFVVDNCTKYIVDSRGGQAYCVQCAIGFVATRSTNFFEVITECPVNESEPAIDDQNNCELQKDHYCECKIDFAHPYDEATNTIDYMTCIPHLNNIKCLAALNDGVCKVCQPGSQLVEATCIQIDIPFCSKFNPNTTVMKSISEYVFPQFGRYGCQKCSSGLTPVFNSNAFISKTNFEIKTRVCVLKNVPTEIVEQIDNCSVDQQAQNLKYYLRNDYLTSPPAISDPLPTYCVNCGNGFTPTKDGKCTLSIDNCILIKRVDSNHCETCQNGFINVAGSCQIPITNCAILEDASQNTIQQCTKCNDGYVLNVTSSDNGIETSCNQYTGSITNCVQFNVIGFQTYCIECEFGFSLLILKNDIQFDQKGYNRRCLDTRTTQQIGCKRFNVNKQQYGVLECEECNDGEQDSYFLTEIEDNFNICVPIDAASNCAQYEIETQLGLQDLDIIYQNNHLPNRSTLQCMFCEQTHFLQQDNSCIERVNDSNFYNQKCQEFYSQLDLCKACVENYFLSIDRLSCIQAPDSELPTGHLWNCSEMNTCNTLVKYQGLDHRIENLLSCHKCKTQGQIPFIAVNGKESFENIIGLKKYGLEGNGVKFSDNEGGRSVFCSFPNAQGLNIPDLDFPNFCGVGIVNVNSAISGDNSATQQGVLTTNIAAMCVACIPGYRAVSAFSLDGSKVDYMIYSCEPIGNCDESQAFNNCTRCEDGYGFIYDGIEVIYSLCTLLPSNNKNCFAISEENVCRFCSKGYYLNSDKICERINPPQCYQTQFFFRNIYSLQELPLGLYLNQNGIGCNRCKDGYLAFFLSEDYWTCTESDYQTGTLVDSTNYIKDCQNYTVMENVLRCSICSQGKVLDVNGICNQSTNNSNLTNCVLSDASGFCNKCNENSVFVDNKCQVKNIPECIEYSQAQNNNEQQCQKCGLGFFLQLNECVSSTIRNCKIQENEKVCDQCEEGFQRSKKNDGTSICYPIDESLNCSEFDLDNFQDGNLECLKCKNNEFVVSYDGSQFYKTHCMKFSEILNCLQYSFNRQLGNSTFDCIECSSNYYLMNNSCVLRTLREDGCSEYSLTKDQCSNCEENQFLSEDNLSCEIYPTGVPQCSEYINATICIKCNNLFYLNNNKCLAVISQIENCVSYSSNTDCQTCLNGFFLVQNQCIAVEATNCLEVENVKTCRSCNQGSGLLTTGNVTNCVEQQIQNCASFSQNPIIGDNESVSYQCLICNPKYYLDNGVCTDVTEEIINCVQYESLTTCMKCNPNTALSIDKTMCMNNVIVSRNLDLNCTSTILIEDPVCNSCSPGFIFVQDNCEPCQVTNPERCYNCDPQNLQSCLLCRTGFYNHNGSCKTEEEYELEVQKAVEESNN